MSKPKLKRGVDLLAEELRQVPDDTEISHEAESQSMTSGEMLNQLIGGGYITSDPSDYRQPTMPSAYRSVPSVTTAHSNPVEAI